MPYVVRKPKGPLTKADYFVLAVICAATSALSLLGVDWLLTELAPIQPESPQVIEAPAEDLQKEPSTISYLL